MDKPATEGPAYLDLIDGVAHKRPDCPAFVEVMSSAKACAGAMTGFVWCPDCGDRSFEESDE